MAHDIFLVVVHSGSECREMENGGWVKNGNERQKKKKELITMNSLLFILHS